ncbi:hypothetical protein PENTCL1PPCAC_17076, partial [Pristionchus entomophagus]
LLKSSQPMINLDNLPPEVINLIIRMDDRSINEMRLISRSWNTQVAKYLSDRKQCLSLERVYLFASEPEDANYSSRAVVDNETRRRNEDAKDNVHMYAILNERYSGGVGIGSWLKIFNRHDEDIVEVNIIPQRITLTKKGESDSFTQLILVIPIISLMHLAAYDYPLIGIFFALTVVPVTMYSIHKLGCLRETRARSRFTRFFSMFAHIETLVLENLKGDSKHESIINAIQWSLGTIQITRLDVSQQECDQDLQERIIELCRSHNIRHVLISSSILSLNKFQKFVFEFSKLDVELDLYETNESDYPGYFGETRLFWREAEDDLMKYNVSMKMITIHDDSFDPDRYPLNVIH